MPRRLLPHLRPGRREAVDDEIRHHLDEATDRLVDEGWAPEAARAEAERRFGDRTQYRAEMLSETDDDGGWMMETIGSLAHDVRLSLRGLRKRPMFAWTLVITLALGIGAAGAIFSMVDAVLLRPLPYEDPDRLIEVELHRAESNITLPMIMADQAEPWLERADFFASTALHERRSMVRTDGPEPEQLPAVVASPALDDVLGIDAFLGRTFADDDGRPGARTVMLSYGYWSRTGRDPDIVGRTVRLDDETWTVIGVLPRGFKYPVGGRTDLWIPLADDLTAFGTPLAQIFVTGRLADGVSLDAAQERADVLRASLAEAQPHEMGWDFRLTGVGDWRGNPDTVRGLWTAFGAVVGMLLIAMVNGLNLQLVRAEERSDEVGVRRALGASRARLFRHGMVESVVLALLAAGVATLLAAAGVAGLRAIAPDALTMIMVHEFGLERRTLAAVFGTALLAGLFVGALPALVSARSGASGGAGGRRLSDRRTRRLRGALVAAEVALSVVLLVGAGLFLRSFAAVQRVDLGMDVERVASAELSLPASRYPAEADRAAFVDEALGALRRLPGVTAASASQGLPPKGGGISFNLAFEAEGEPAQAVDPEEVTSYNLVQPGYFEVLGTSFVDGRAFRAGDRDVNGVIVDRDLARRIFGDELVAGRRFRTDPDQAWRTVVGVVDDIKLSGPDDQYGPGTLVYPMDPASPPRFITLAVRTNGDPAALLQAMRATFLALDDKLPLRALQTGEDAYADALVRPRFLVLLISVLAGVSLLLATVGLFGVISYTVARGRREMGIRMALGASGGRVRAGVLQWGFAVAAVGVGLGLAAAAVVDDVAESLLFGVAPGDLPTNVAVGATMLAAALLACWIPALRATRVDPVDVLRPE